MATAKKSEVKIVPDDTAPEVLAKAILEVSEGAKKLLASRLTNEAVLVLLKHQTGVPMRTIKTVLEGAVGLKRFVR